MEEPRIYLITGVMASGKSTVAELLAKRFARGVHLRGDGFRKMIVSGREEMRENPPEEALRQLSLRYDLTAMAAKMYYDHGFTVVMQDNYYGEALPAMAERLAGYPLEIVVLVPRVEVVAQREATRGKTGYGGYSVEPLYRAFLETTPRLGRWIDSSDQTAEETCRAILAGDEA